MNPVIRRELQISGRNPALYRYRTIVATLAIIVAMLCILFSSSAPALAGRTMFDVFAWGAFLLCLMEGARAAADSISAEKREGTLGLLFLTDLRTRDVVLGKLTFVGIRSLVLLLPVLPAFAVPLLLGGVTGGESWRVMITLLVTLLFGLSAALWASSLSVNSTAALGKTALILMLMTVEPAVRFVGGNPAWPLPADWMSGPLGMMIASGDSRFSANPASFWLAGIISVILSALMVAAAGHFSHRHVAIVPIIAKPRWWLRWLQPRRGYVPPWGEASDQSPAVWLAARTLPGQRTLWLLIGLALIASFASGLFGLILFAVILQVLFGMLLKFWIAVVAPQSLHELRKTGALELILCTPLQPHSIVRGQVDLLYESLIGPALVVAVGFPIALYGGSLLTRAEIAEPPVMVPAGMIWFVYTVLDLHALGYLSMWHGLSSNRIEAAIGKTAWYGLILPWLFVLVPVIGWVTLLFWPVILITWAKNRLIERFHEMAARAS